MLVCHRRSGHHQQHHHHQPQLDNPNKLRIIPRRSLWIEILKAHSPIISHILYPHPYRALDDCMYACIHRDRLGIISRPIEPHTVCVRIPWVNQSVVPTFNTVLAGGRSSSAVSGHTMMVGGSGSTYFTSSPPPSPASSSR